MSDIDVRDLTVVLDDGSTIVDSASLRLDRGEVMGVVGESGSGKSTLALSLLGFTKPGASIASGSVVVDDVDVLNVSQAGLRDARKRLIGFVPQDPATALNPSVRIGTQLIEGLVDERPAALARIKELLGAVGLPTSDAFLRRLPRQLSGGQQQRVTIAMAVAKAPRLIVLDEPTTGLDVSTQAAVLSMVRELCEARDMAAVFVSHDLAAVGSLADLVTVMYGGQAVETGTSVQVVRSPAHPYTIALLNSLPSATERRRLTPIPGNPPAPSRRHAGCVFADRCGFVESACRQSAAATHVEIIEGRQVRCLRTEHVGARHDLASAASPAAASERVCSHEAPLLTVRDLNATYGREQVLFDVAAEVDAGECLAVVGESGSGKTTMSRCLIGLHSGQSGQYTLAGAELSPFLRFRDDRVKRDIQYIFQNPYASLNGRRTVINSVAVPVKRFFGERGNSARTRAREALDRVKIPSRLADRYPSELSGGERQRVAIARALVCEPSLLICDEVTSALDVSVQASIIEMLRSLLSDGLGMIFITHNLAVVRSIADSLSVLRNGRIVESGPVAAVLTSPTDEYTKRLLADAPEIDRTEHGNADLGYELESG